MSRFIKKELPPQKYLFYCYTSINTKNKRLRKKAEKIVQYQIEVFCPHF